MPPKRGPPKDNPPSRKTKQPAGQPQPILQAQTQEASGPRTSSNSANRQNKLQKIKTTAPPRSTRHTRRSQGSPLLDFVDAIDKLTGKGRQEPKKATLNVESTPRAEAPSRRQQTHKQSQPLSNFRQVLPSIEAAFNENLARQGEQLELDSTLSRNLQIEENLSSYDSTDSTIASWLVKSPDAKEVFLQRSGYVVPLSKEVLAAIDVVLGSKAASRMAGISSTNPEFGKTLKEDRKVMLTETKREDPEWAHLDQHRFDRQAEEGSIANFLNGLWFADLEFCKEQQEAIFQRTIMMSMVSRHQLIFSLGKTLDGLPESALIFSVEASWTCDPMPTARFRWAKGKPIEKPKTFTNLPKPDLCISFRTSKIIDEDLWEKLPCDTQRLICYEGIDGNETERAFGFFFVEAKRSRIDPDDKTALHQALNDASQALHNMYEFFKEAGLTAEFFERVRVFSATASERGVILRVHRPIELPEDKGLAIKRIVEDYPLRFEYRIYKTFRGDSFDRQKVVEAFARIMRGYGENQLLKLLQKASEKVNIKVLSAWQNRHTVEFDKTFNDYRHGQFGKPGSRAGSKQQTPAIGGSQSASLVAMPPPNLLRPLQESQSSDGTEVIDETRGGTTLSQGISGLQAHSFDSQRSKSSERRRRALSPEEGDISINKSKRPRRGGTRHSE